MVEFAAMKAHTVILKHLWEGLFTGLLLGIVHTLLLYRAGLYVLVGPFEMATSVARYLALFSFAGAGIGLVVGLFLAVPTNLQKLTYPQPVRPASLLAVVAYGLAWTVFVVDDRFGRQMVAPTVSVFIGILLLLFVMIVLWTGRFHPRRRKVTAPVKATFYLLLIMAAFYISPMLIRGGAVPAGPPRATSELERLRPDAVKTFTDHAARFRRSKRWNVLLLTIDTLRADHLGMYGYDRNTSPVLDTLATMGVRFDRAYCPRPKTSPSFATILTGTWPARHGITGAMQRLTDDNETLAEYMRSAGYTTGAVITNGNLYPAFGFDQGFDSYAFGQSGEANADLALEWLGANADPDTPWFLWVHYTNPHAPYNPPAPFDTLFGKAPEGSLERYIQLYDGEIRYTDTEIGRILEWLKKRMLHDNTLVVFCADHGESLGEHNYYFSHGLHPYEPSARIPLVLSAQGMLPRDRSSDAVIAAVDILPTILDAMDIPTGEEIQGQSFLPLALGLSEAGPRDYALIEAGYGVHAEAGETIALRRGSTKYVHRLRQWALYPHGPKTVFWTINAKIEGGLAPDELYDLDTDPQELDNILMERREFSMAEQKLLRAFAAQLYSSGRHGTIDPKKLDPKTVESLKSLGYL